MPSISPPTTCRFTCLYEKDTVALPRLVEQGKRIQFCFIDGLHTFDYTMIDAFYADQVYSHMHQRLQACAPMHVVESPAHRMYSDLPHRKLY